MLKELLCGMWVAMSLVGFAAMGVDKARAKRGAWRISEARLMAVAALLGAPGVLLGMLTFRHKIRHPKFRFGVPLLLAAQIALFCWIGGVFR
ncbi:MAG: DUF1294 domain-containing protein [Christensenellales bacterium]|jgi:uncharacterized membrane protein YsdA (DUF1294 family)